jgi:hypothetical protein
MRAVAVGFYPNRDTLPPRGDRIATWAERLMQRTGMGISELAHRLPADKRDLRRLIAKRSCGPKLNDSFERAFGLDFILNVSAAGPDEIAVFQAELANDHAIIAAREQRIARLTAAAEARGLVVGGEARSWAGLDGAGAARGGDNGSGLGVGEARPLNHRAPVMKRRGR